jgi:arylsulfatase A-like enzyme
MDDCMKCLLSVVAMVLVVAQTFGADARSKPNIIVILADDLGWADVGFNGCREIPTPHLDGLAKSGVRFTAGYASHPYCSPSRAGLLTGKHQQRFGHECNPMRKADGLPLSETLLPAMLKPQGYTTAAIGKWHLGDEEPYWPIRRGFDDWFGFTGGSMTYWGKDGPASGIVRNGSPVPKSELKYLTDDFTNEAVAFVERNRSRPFFLYLAYNAPHSPNHVTREHLQLTEHIENGGKAVYAAMIAGMDAGIGKVLAKLDALKLRENTLVVFYSDNGGRVDGANNYPFRGHKGQLFEGGIRVPFLVSWPARIPAGQEIDAPVTGLDVAPTALAAAGVSVPPSQILDGTDLLPFLDGAKKPLPPRTLFWRYAMSADTFGYAVREGDLKLYSRGAGDLVYLFDLKTDPYEHHNLASERKDVVEKLTAKYTEWAKQMKPPVFLDPHGASIRGEVAGRQRVIESASQGQADKK